MIDNTITQIKEARATILRDPPNDFRVMAGFEMARAAAKRDIEGLLKKLSSELMSIAVPVFISGPGAVELATKMSEATPAATVDLNNIHQTLFNAVSPSIGRDRTFTVPQFMLVVSTLRQLALDNGFGAIENLTFEEPVVVKTDEDLRKVIQKYTDKAVGVELAAEYARNQAAEQAIVALDGQTVPVFPVFLLNTIASHQTAMARTFKRPVEIFIQAPDVVTEEVVIEALKTIKKSLKKNKE